MKSSPNTRARARSCRSPGLPTRSFRPRWSSRARGWCSHGGKDVRDRRASTGVCIAASVVYGLILFALGGGGRAMTERIGQRTLRFDQAPRILSHAAAVGKKEGAGPLGARFDFVAPDDRMGQKSWELAESELQKTAIRTALQKGGLSRDDLDLVLAGDLLNQCTGSFLASMQSDVPYLGQYGACSTMAQGAGARRLPARRRGRAAAARGRVLAFLLGRAAVPLSARLRRPAHPNRPVDRHRGGRGGAGRKAAPPQKRPTRGEAVLAAGQPRRKKRPTGGRGGAGRRAAPPQKRPTGGRRRPQAGPGRTRRTAICSSRTRCSARWSRWV